MSHTSTVKSIKIVSLTALEAAVKELAASGVKCDIARNVAPRAYYEGQSGLGVAPLVIKLHDAAYDIGIYKTEEGHYEARTDFWGGSVARCLGTPASSPETREQAQMGKLFQMYGIHATMETARRKGHMVRRINKQDGTVALELSGPNL